MYFLQLALYFLVYSTSSDDGCFEKNSDPSSEMLIIDEDYKTVHFATNLFESRSNFEKPKQSPQLIRAEAESNALETYQSHFPLDLSLQGQTQPLDLSNPKTNPLNCASKKHRALKRTKNINYEPSPDVLVLQDEEPPLDLTTGRKKINFSDTSQMSTISSYPLHDREPDQCPSFNSSTCSDIVASTTSQPISNFDFLYTKNKTSEGTLKPSTILSSDGQNVLHEISPKTKTIKHPEFLQPFKIVVEITHNIIMSTCKIFDLDCSMLNISKDVKNVTLMNKEIRGYINIIKEGNIVFLEHDQQIGNIFEMFVKSLHVLIDLNKFKDVLKHLNEFMKSFDYTLDIKKFFRAFILEIRKSDQRDAFGFALMMLNKYPSDKINTSEEQVNRIKFTLCWLIGWFKIYNYIKITSSFKGKRFKLKFVEQVLRRLLFRKSFDSTPLELYNKLEHITYQLSSSHKNNNVDFPFIGFLLKSLGDFNKFDQFSAFYMKNPSPVVKYDEENILHCFSKSIENYLVLKSVLFKKIGVSYNVLMFQKIEE